MSRSHEPKPVPLRRVNVRKAALLGGLGVFALFLVFLVVTGETWQAIAYALVVLFAFLLLLAVFFWGAILLDGVTALFGSRRSAGSWSLAKSGLEDIPDYDIDPGLELLAAGVLVYRMSEVRPHIHFRQVPLSNTRAIRPFVVARTGSERPYQFSFSLTDGHDSARFDDEFTLNLTDAPQIVMPPYRLSISAPQKLEGQRWTLQVRSGLTVVTSFRFLFVDAALPEPDEPVLEWQRDLLPRLLDEALKRDAMSTTQEISIEGT